jgi:hypothetical protein
MCGLIAFDTGPPVPYSVSAISRSRLDIEDPFGAVDHRTRGGDRVEDRPGGASMSKITACSMSIRNLRP